MAPTRHRPTHDCCPSCPLTQESDSLYIYTFSPLRFVFHFLFLVFLCSFLCFLFFLMCSFFICFCFVCFRISFSFFLLCSLCISFVLLVCSNLLYIYYTFSSLQVGRLLVFVLLCSPCSYYRCCLFFLGSVVQSICAHLPRAQCTGTLLTWTKGTLAH